MLSDEQVKEKIIEISGKSGSKTINSVDARKAFLGNVQPAAANKIVQIFNELQVTPTFVPSHTPTHSISLINSFTYLFLCIFPFRRLV